MKLNSARLLNILWCFSFLMLGISGRTQDDKVAVEDVKTTLMKYIEGRNNGQLTMLRSAFHESADLRFMNIDGNYTILGINEYVQQFQEGRKIDCEVSILYVDVEGTSAQAKVEIVYPDRIFTDYLNLLQVDQRWLIVSKTFSSKLLSEEEIQVHSARLKIDSFVSELVEEYGIPGVALAVIKKGKVWYENYHGKASLEHKVDITENTIFRLYSLTKPFVAVGAFQLIEDGKLNLNDSISMFVQDLPKKWGKVQLKNLLSFSSGLPEIAEPYREVKDLNEDILKRRVYDKEMIFSIGEKFRYNQTDFWLLQKVLEQVSGLTLSDYIIKNQFAESMDSVFFSSDSRDIIVHRATPYFPFEKNELTIVHPYYTGDYALGMNGLHLTLSEFINWDIRLYENEMISEDTKTKMWSNFTYDNDDVFCHGWAKYSEAHKESYGFTGSGCNLYRHYPNDGLSIIFLSNGFERPYDLAQVAQKIRYILQSRE